MPHVVLDFDPPQPDAPDFATHTSDLVFFLSWAFSARYGASHELSEAAELLRRDLKIDLVPLLTFADRDVETPEDQDVLDRSWQDAAPLAACCEQVANALESDEDRFGTLLEEYPGLTPAIRDLGRIAAWVAEHGARIRVTYSMEET